MKVYLCEKCGNLAIIYKPTACIPKCCGDSMKVLEPNTVDAAVEKHVPDVTADGSSIRVQVGSVEHPMTEEHYIQFILLETDRGYQVKYLTPADKPAAEFSVAGEKPLAVYALCNIHGLWKKEL